MSKAVRFSVLLIVVALAAWLLMPTVRWYYMTDPQSKKLLKMSEDKIDTLAPEIKKKILHLKKIRKGSLNLGLDLQGGVRIVGQVNSASLKKQLMEKYEYDEDKVKAAWNDELLEATRRQLEILKNRMDTFGVSEPTIRRTYDNKISIELPGMDNPQQIRDALSKVGLLEFHIVDEKSMKNLQILNVNMYKGYVVSRENIPQDFVLPEGSAWYSYWENDQYGIPKMLGWYVLKTKVELDGTKIKNARSDTDNYGRPQVAFELNAEGADIFSEVTAKNIKKRLAIVMDGKVKSAPTIQTEIGGGSGVITGDFSLEETVFLANVLKSGALPVKMDIVEERVIGPTLGKDSILSGTKAALLGALAVVIFMIFYYRVAGLVAVIALSFNMFFLVALLAGIHATLTLTGIAGIALTVGMAVDANVIIYERIREEMRRSKAFSHALENGYKNANSTIWDSNLTTLIAAFALFIFGAGNIKGFGITLTFGILSNIFAALFITRLLFDWMLDTFKLKKLSL